MLIGSIDKDWEYFSTVLKMCSVVVLLSLRKDEFDRGLGRFLHSNMVEVGLVFLVPDWWLAGWLCHDGRVIPVASGNTTESPNEQNILCISHPLSVVISARVSAIHDGCDGLMLYELLTRLWPLILALWCFLNGYSIFLDTLEVFGRVYLCTCTYFFPLSLYLLFSLSRS